MLIFPEPRRVSDSGSCVSYADRRWLVLPAEAGFELKEAAMCAAELLSERFFSPVEVTAGTPGAGARLLTMVRDSTLPPEGYRLETTPEQALLCFDAADDPCWNPVFD